MNYRDERDALRGRIEGLEQDLHDARRMQHDDAQKRARIEQIEARMRETENNLQAMRAELAALDGRPRPKKNHVPLFLAIGISFLVAAIGAVFLVGVPRRPPAYATPKVTEVEPAVPIIEPPPVDTVKPIPAAARSVQAQWIGKATRVQGLSGAPGTPCIVDATLESEGDKQHVSELTVKCNDKFVYRSTDKLEGMSMSGYGFAEERGKESGTFAYAVSYNDTGARSGPRTQVSIDTTQGQGAVWSEVIPIFRVEFSLPTRSTPVKGEALMSEKN